MNERNGELEKEKKMFILDGWALNFFNLRENWENKIQIKSLIFFFF